MSDLLSYLALLVGPCLLLAAINEVVQAKRRRRW